MTVKRMWALEGGTLTYTASDLVLTAGPDEVTIPVPTFLVEHERGLLLFDTGLAPESADATEAVYGPMAAAARITLTEEQRVDRQLAKIGFSPSDVTHVVVSHAHWDHVGGLHLFAQAQVFAGVGEVPHAYWPNSPAYSAAYRLADLDGARGFAWHTLTGDHDVFGDGSVLLLLTPGHTPGHLSMLVRLPDGPLLLTGDATHLRAGWERMLPMGFDYSTDRAVASLQRLARLADATGARVWINHDPDDWAAFGGAGQIGHMHAQAE